MSVDSNNGANGSGASASASNSAGGSGNINQGGSGASNMDAMGSNSISYNPQRIASNAANSENGGSTNRAESGSDNNGNRNGIQIGQPLDSNNQPNGPQVVVLQPGQSPVETNSHASSSGGASSSNPSHSAHEDSDGNARPESYGLTSEQGNAATSNYHMSLMMGRNPTQALHEAAQAAGSSIGAAAIAFILHQISSDGRHMEFRH